LTFLKPIVKSSFVRFGKPAVRYYMRKKKN